MIGQETSTRELLADYFRALSSQPKTETLMDQFITDNTLKEHIRQTEAAFPHYSLTVDQMITEGDTAALRATFHGTHRGPFHGIPATGKTVSAEVMLFYRVRDGRIAQHWMQMDGHALMQQLMPA